MLWALLRVIGPTRCEVTFYVPSINYEDLAMIRWIIAIFLVLVLISWLAPWLEKFGIGRLPGDIRLTLFGHAWNLPITTAIVLSALASLISKWM